MDEKQNVRETSLYNLFKQFIEKALLTLKDLTIKEPLPLRPREEVVVSDSQFSGTKFRIVQDFFSFLQRHEQDIEALFEYQSLIQSMTKLPSVQEFFRGRISDAMGKPVEKPNLAPFVKRDFVDAFLRKYLEEQGAFEFDEERFAMLYSQMDEYIDKKARVDRYYSPLHNFSSEQDNIEFEDHLRIRKLVGEDLKIFLQGELFNLYGFLPALELTSQEIFVIEAEVEHPKGEPKSDATARLVFSKTASILRLYKDGNFGFSVIYSEPILSWNEGRTATMSAQTRMRFFGSRWKISKDEIPKLKEFWSRCSTLLRKVESLKFINRALKRFNSAIEEFELEDKLIDLVIALEALYLIEKDELGYRLSLRVSVLLQNDIEDVSYVRELVKKGYDLRSDVVHGKSVKRVKIRDQVITLDKVVNDLEDIVRKSIRRLIALGSRLNQHEKIVLRIDQAILDEKVREELIADSQDLVKLLIS
jgi:hypothetical protein